MKKILSLSLDEDLYQRLRSLCGDDEAAMEQFIVDAVTRRIQNVKTAETDSPGDLRDLDDYLKKGEPGSRSYGVKGQGW